MFRIIFNLFRLQLLRALLKKITYHPKLKKFVPAIGPLMILLEWVMKQRSLKRYR